MRKKKNRIPQQKIPDKVIPDPKVPLRTSNGFIFCTVYHDWTKGTDAFYKKYKFTNMVLDAQQFSNNITEIGTEFIPKLFSEFATLFNVGNKNYHCHPVSKDKLDMVSEIAGYIYNNNFSNKDLSSAGLQWWYLGFKGSLRLVGLYNKSENTFYPMFIDHHHLIHGDDHYNQPDFKNYNYCPIVEYNK